MEDITTQNVTEGFGLMYYREASRRGNTRMYDPALGRFTSADTIIPPMQGVQAWDRYAYVNNSPVMYTDPTGHACVNNGGTDDEVAMPGNCGGGANSNYTGGMQGPGWNNNQKKAIENDGEWHSSYVGGATPESVYHWQHLSVPDSKDVSDPFIDGLDELVRMLKMYSPTAPSTLKVLLSYLVHESGDVGGGMCQ